jgi:hypothetical protein
MNPHQGLDIHDVMIVIQYGILKNMFEAAQQGGHAVQDGHLCGLYFIIVETWALEVELTDEHDDHHDPDKPYAAILKRNSSKKD